MELKFPAYNLQVDATTTTNMKKKEDNNIHHERPHENEEEYDNDNDSESSSLSLRHLSKVILPPLGVSSYNSYTSNIHSKGWIISPMDSKYRCWESLMVMLVFYSAWVYPFEVAFLHSSPKRRLFIADNIVDFFFTIDIVLTFFVAYIDPTTQLLVRDPRKISLR
ncbi:hypothetical protein ACFE04_022506 [Oxalis oulophora]